MPSGDRSFYVYIFYHPVNCDPVYVGKGRGNRAESHRSDTHNLFLFSLLKRFPDARPVYVETQLSEEEAYAIEQSLISEYGKQIDGTGTLFNVREGGLDEHSKGRQIEFRGRAYRSIKALARHFGVKEGTLWNRLFRLGWTLEEAVGVSPRKHDRHDRRYNPVDFRGKHYASHAALAKEYGIRPNRFHARIKSGWSIPEALGLTPRQRKLPSGRERNVTCDGKVYKDVTKLARAFGISRSVVHDRLRIGWTPEEAVGLAQRAQSGKKPQPIRAFGESFISVQELSRDKRCIVSSVTLTRRIKKGMSPDEAATTRQFDRKLRVGAKGPENHPLWNPIYYQGKRYRSHRQLAKAFGVPYATFVKRLNVKGWPLDEALGVRSRKKKRSTKPIAIGGNQFSSYREAAMFHGVNRHVFANRLRAGWTPEEAAGLVARERHSNNGKRVQVEGKEYASIKEAAKAYRISLTTVYGRRACGWTLDEVLGIVPRGDP